MGQLCWSLCISIALVISNFEEGNSFFLLEGGTPTGVIVQLFEWKFEDIADECSFVLGPNGYSGIQVSPITENVIIEGRPWEERYEPVSFKINSRSGNEEAFTSMVKICNRKAVKVYVDVVINHMTRTYTPATRSTGDSRFDSIELNYHGAHFTKVDFHRQCLLKDDKNPDDLRNCEVDGRHDLDQSRFHVRCTISEFLNKLIEIGVAGFSIDSAKHMWPSDLKAIYDRLAYLNSYKGFGYAKKPFIYQDLTLGGEYRYEDYYKLSHVADYQYALALTQYFKGEKRFRDIRKIDEKSSIPADKAVVFLDNHLTERGMVDQLKQPLTYKNALEDRSNAYKLALIFMLAWPRGIPRILSSYKFKDPKAGPPISFMNDDIIQSPTVNGKCRSDWTCMHTQPDILKMVKFRKYAGNGAVENWWESADKEQIAFSRGKVAFIAFNLVKGENMEEMALQTGLPPGEYCDIISGDLLKLGTCSGRSITVEEDGTAKVKVGPESALAVHLRSRRLWFVDTEKLEA